MLVDATGTAVCVGAVVGCAGSPVDVAVGDSAAGLVPGCGGLEPIRLVIRCAGKA